MQNVKCICLVSGQVLIGGIKENKHEGTYILKNPMTLNPTADGMVMLPPVLFMDYQNLEVSKHHVVWIADATEQVSEAWNEKFGSGLSLPKDKKLVV